MQQAMALAGLGPGHPLFPGGGYAAPGDAPPPALIPPGYFEPYDSYSRYSAAGGW